MEFDCIVLIIAFLSTSQGSNLSVNTLACFNIKGRSHLLVFINLIGKKSEKKISLESFVQIAK